MSDFVLDTSGTVRWSEADVFDGQCHWSDLDCVTQGYIEALFEDGWDWPSTRCPGPRGFSDLDPKALAAIVADCRAYQGERPLLWGYAGFRAGASFWRMRQTGVEPVASGFPPVRVFLGDEGQVCIEREGVVP